MPVTDLGKVTSTLETLLKKNVKRLTGFGFDVTAAPPDVVTTKSSEATFDKVISLHLYHIEEDPYFKNLPGSGTDIPDVATAPMALKLHYVVTAHTLENPDLLEDDKFLMRQTLFGAALKTMHDFPVITDDTEVLDDTLTVFTVMDPALRGQGNVLQIVLRPMKPEDSVTFWSAEDKFGARLSAFYEVRVVMLEPERPTAVAKGIVLTVGNFVFPQGTPQILASASKVGFRLPQTLGGAGQGLDATPARPSIVGASWPPAAGSFHQDFLPPVTLASVQEVLADNGKFDLIGGDLQRDETRLVLRNANFRKFIDTTRVVLDRPSNASWYASPITGTRATFAVQESFQFGSTAVPILPGTYGVSLSVIRFVPQFGGLSRELATLSNEVPVLITPQIVSIDAPGSDTFSVVIAGSYLPTTLSPSPQEALEAAGLDVLLVVGGVAYTPARSIPSLNEELVVTSPASLQFTLTAELSTLLANTGFLSVRLVINGTEAPPIWLQSEGAP